MRKIHVLFPILVLILGVGCKKDDAKKSDEPKQGVQSEEPEKSATPDPTAPAAPASATAALAPSSGSSVAGTITFTEKDGQIEVVVKVTGLTPGDHGFHVHEKGDCSAADATSAGGHFNPAGVEHGAPGSGKHHTGDLGNLTANEEGVAEKTLSVDFLSLKDGDPNNVRGKAVIVHGSADDLASQPAGNAGPRVACGVVQ